MNVASEANTSEKYAKKRFYMSKDIYWYAMIRTRDNRVARWLASLTEKKGGGADGCI